MRTIVKKLQVSAVLLILLFSGLITASVSAEAPVETVVYRYGPDGSIKPIRITLDAGKELVDAILDKCRDLLKNDAEMQSFISNCSFFSEIKSSGKGFHWKSPLSFRIPFTILFRYDLFKWIELKYRLFGLNVVPRVFCNYSNDADALTEITPLPTPTGQNPNTTKVEGNHSITALGFIGYTGWRGMTAGWFERRDRETGFIGYSLLTSYKSY
jgi:hypothetical protein